MVVLHCKVVVLGDPCVGKSAMIQMFSTNGANFPKNYVMTMGVDYCVKEVAVEGAQPPSSVEMNIFDLSGQDIYSKSIEQYLENTSCCVIVYDSTNKRSYENCTKWLDTCRKVKKNMLGVLVGNKKDLKERQVIAPIIAEGYAKSHNLQFFHISSSAKADVELPFVHLAKQFHKLYEDKIKSLTAATTR